ncbi:MAG: hypothetical protein K2K23_03960, partial [Muribaculaceae bacterium]|nr:hypothetical protein [Muribaculaceae bacterium]
FVYFAKMLPFCYHKFYFQSPFHRHIHKKSLKYSRKSSKKRNREVAFILSVAPRATHQTEITDPDMLCHEYFPESVFSVWWPMRGIGKKAPQYFGLL